MEKLLQIYQTCTITLKASAIIRKAVLSATEYNQNNMEKTATEMKLVILLTCKGKRKSTVRPITPTIYLFSDLHVGSACGGRSLSKNAPWEGRTPVLFRCRLNEPNGCYVFYHSFKLSGSWLFGNLVCVNVVQRLPCATKIRWDSQKLTLSSRQYIQIFTYEHLYDKSFIPSPFYAQYGNRMLSCQFSGFLMILQ